MDIYFSLSVNTYEASFAAESQNDTSSHGSS